MLFPRVPSRTLIGLILVALGIMFLLDSTHAFGPDTRIVSTYWPVLLIAWGLWGLVSSRFRWVLWPVAILAIGVVLLLSKLQVWAWSAGQLWPVILVIIGLALLFRWRIPGPGGHRNAGP